MTETAPRASSFCFPETQWTEVIGAIQGGDGGAAWVGLTSFCEQYRPAICGFFRRHGCGPEQAEDLTQDFFAGRILEQWQERNGFLHALRRGECVRFRSFLCHVLWRFLQDKWKENNAQQAGGGATHVPLERLETAVDADRGRTVSTRSRMSFGHTGTAPAGAVSGHP